MRIIQNPLDVGSIPPPTTDNTVKKANTVAKMLLSYPECVMVNIRYLAVFLCTGVEYTGRRIRREEMWQLPSAYAKQINERD
jgi:hypothetical protein